MGGAAYLSLESRLEVTSQRLAAQLSGYLRPSSRASLDRKESRVRGPPPAQPFPWFDQGHWGRFPLVYGRAVFGRRRSNAGLRLGSQSGPKPSALNWYVSEPLRPSATIGSMRSSWVPAREGLQ